MVKEASSPSPATAPDAASGATEGTLRLVDAVARASQVLLSGDTKDPVIPRALGMLAESLVVDRAYLFENHADPQTGSMLCSQRYEWCRPGTSPQINNPSMQGMAYEPLFKELYAKLRARKSFGGPLTELPEELRPVMAVQDIQSLLVVPVYTQGNLWGFVGFDDCRQPRVWTPTDEALLFALAGSLGSLLARQETERQLQARDNLLRGVALATQELLSAPDLDSGLAQSLASLGQAAGVDRAYILENWTGPDRQQRRLRARYVWNRLAGATDARTRRQDFSYDEVLPRWHEILSAGRPISGRILDLFALPQPGITVPLRSILLVPILSEGRFWGIVGFDDQNVNRVWADGDEAILHAVAGGIGGAIARQKAEQALRNSEEHFRSLIENVSDIIAILDQEGRIEYLSPASERTLGYRPEELAGQLASGLLHPEDALSMEQLREVLTLHPEAIRTAEFRLKHADGTWHYVEGVAKATQDDGVRRYVVTVRDINSRKKAEQALQQSTDLLRHSQKMEAVGRLAGGVAHDFNNLLTAIMGYSELLLEQLPSGQPMRHEIEEISKAADRAHGVTRQLLAFSRKQVLEPKLVSLNTVVTDVHKLLNRLIGEDIDLELDLDRNLGTVRLDPGQMEQVLINLSVNARDAMSEGGRITLRTANVNVPRRITYRHLSVEPGHYVTLSVRDTGEGMDESVQAHLFEPFFTTKPVGKGTGLGLSMVYGIIQQSGGQILFESAPGQGTTFTLYFPRVEEFAAEAGDRVEGQAAGGHETILLVEDEEIVRELAARVLRERGYTVLVARNGPEALRLMEQQHGRVNLLLTDIVMPQLGGLALAQRLKEHHPTLCVLYMSGYAEQSSAALDALSLERNYLQKPFTPAALARKVRDVLDAD